MVRASLLALLPALAAAQDLMEVRTHPGALLGAYANTYVIGAYDTRIATAYDATNGQQRFQVPMGQSFFAETRHLYSYDPQRGVQVFDGADGHSLATLPITGQLGAVLELPDGGVLINEVSTEQVWTVYEANGRQRWRRSLASWVAASVFEDAIVLGEEVISVTDGAHRWSLPPNLDVVWVGEHRIVARAEHQLRVFDAANGNLLRQINLHRNDPIDARIFNGVLYSVETAGSLRVGLVAYDIATGRARWRARPIAAATVEVGHLIGAIPNVVFALMPDGTVRGYDIADGNMRFTYGVGYQDNTYMVSTDPVRIATSDNANVRVLEVSASAPPLEHARIHGHLTCHAVGPPGGRLIQVGSTLLRVDDEGRFATKVINRGTVIVRAVPRTREDASVVVIELDGSLQYTADLEIFQGE